MTIEFTIDEFRNALRTSMVRHGAEEIMRQECQKILDRHRQAMIEDLEKVISSFTVHCLSEPQNAMTKMKITLPDA